MKTLLTTITAIAIALIATPTKAEAGILKIGATVKIVSGYSSCGCPIYTKRVVSGFDRFQRPIYKSYRLPSNCHCGVKHRKSLVRSGVVNRTGSRVSNSFTRNNRNAVSSRRRSSRG